MQGFPLPGGDVCKAAVLGLLASSLQKICWSSAGRWGTVVAAAPVAADIPGVMLSQRTWLMSC
jgi:hypothetical protein